MFLKYFCEEKTHSKHLKKLNIIVLQLHQHWIIVWKFFDGIYISGSFLKQKTNA